MTYMLNKTNSIEGAPSNASNTVVALRKNLLQMHEHKRFSFLFQWWFDIGLFSDALKFQVL